MTWVPGERVESPSLSSSGTGDGPAFELKFLVDEPQARAVEQYLHGRLPFDPHGDPDRGAYQTTTLYLDTPGLDVFHRLPPLKRRKFRLRRYGTDAHIFLERKMRANDRVRKRRSAVPVDELPLLANPLSVSDWSGRWFHQRLLARGLRPSCLIGYERTAYTAITAEGPLRLTLDRHLRGAPAQDWRVEPCERGLPFLSGQVILEFKFRTALPALFKELIQEFQLAPGSASKYRLCLRAWGVGAGRGEAADA